MRRFECVCANQVFFESMQCLGCSRLLGFSPERQTLLSLEPVPDGGLRPAASAEVGERVRACSHRESAGCNWLVAGDDPNALCRACRLNHSLPSLELPASVERWRLLEQTKRRLLRALLALRLEFETPGPYGTPALAFAFKEDTQTNPLVTEDYVISGHLEGLVTLNVAEADPAYRERMRVALGQPYRTVLGHLRHEAGHFFFDRLLRSSPLITRFREIFGDERIDYTRSLSDFYAGRASPPGSGHVSAYATAHPLEDWAECFAHLLHIHDTLETAAAYGFGGEPGAAHWLERFRNLSVLLNELNRSMGHPDAYPFVITAEIGAKLELIRDLVRQAGHAIGSEAAL